MGPVLDQVGEVGDYDIHAEQFGLGEHESGIDDDDVIPQRMAMQFMPNSPSPPKVQPVAFYWHPAIFDASTACGVRFAAPRRDRAARAYTGETHHAK